MMHTYPTHRYRDLMPGTNNARVVCLECGLIEPTQEILEIRWGSGCKGSHGTAGAPGRLTHVSETLGRALTGAFSTHVVGSNTFQGLVTHISWRWSGVRAGECILMVSFDSQTFQRLKENLSGPLGMRDTAGAVYSVTIVREEPLST